MGSKSLTNCIKLSLYKTKFYNNFTRNSSGDRCNLGEYCPHLFGWVEPSINLSGFKTQQFFANKCKTKGNSRHETILVLHFWHSADWNSFIEISATTIKWCCCWILLHKIEVKLQSYNFDRIVRQRRWPDFTLKNISSRYLTATSKWFWPKYASNGGGQILRLKTFHQDIWYGMTRKSLVPTTTTLYH